MREVAMRVSKGERIPEIIKQVLAVDPDLSLIKLTNTPIAAIVTNKQPAPGAQNTAQTNQHDGLAELGLTVEFASGDYFATLRYLERLEKLQWWFWDALDYQVIAYPSAKVTLKLHTISQPR